MISNNENPTLKKRSIDILESNLLHLLEITGTPADTISDLEFKLRSRDDDEKLHAQDEINALIDNLLKGSRTSSSTAIALKLYSDIFEHDKTPNIRALIRPEEDRETPGFDPIGTDSKKGYIESLSELKKSNLAYFVEIYTHSLHPGAIASSFEPTTYETPQRRYVLIQRSLPEQIKEKLKLADVFLKRTPKTRYITLLKMLDLHCELRPSSSDTKSIQLAIDTWIATLNWDKENLSKHTQQPREFFTIATEVINKALGFKSIGTDPIKNIGDIAEKLDLICSYEFISSTRKAYLDKIEKTWRDSKKPKKLPKVPASPVKRPSFAIDKECHDALSRKIIEKTQPASVNRVINNLSNHSAKALRDIKNSDRLHSLKSSRTKKRINVDISISTDRKIDLLREKLGVTRSQLLVHAINYYLQPSKFKPAKDSASTAKKQENTKKSAAESKLQSKTLPPETTQTEPPELPLDTKPAEPLSPDNAKHQQLLESEAALTKKLENTTPTEPADKTEPVNSPNNQIHTEQDIQVPNELQKLLDRDKALQKLRGNKR